MSSEPMYVHLAQLCSAGLAGSKAADMSPLTWKTSASGSDLSPAASTDCASGSPSEASASPVLTSSPDPQMAVSPASSERTMPAPSRQSVQNHESRTCK
eukprot:CAMPEP_0176284894 /NCGR_PEP_ID=MMETSP0121_2-20121125/52086_1 /TAXON_ID=160619 /ORGANISM="Kryptoperidinium foliaceum, Strain CCMP 1326" /LENGTH=98 /DNA_ID=CAMNT_0017625355 /DNA_START=4 /DNA_END=297 /DNA_ORIENTATION=-